MHGLFAILLSFSFISSRLFDLNTADARLLETVPGIGRATAEAIVDHRTAYGPFMDMEELEFVSGIGPSTIEALSMHVYIDSSSVPAPDRSHWLPEVDALSPSIEVFFLDVGQGDAILVRAAEGMTLLFDGGPDGGGPLEPPVVFRLRELGVDTIHVLAFSHPHADHIGGLHSVLENFTVLQVLDPGMTFPSPVYEDLLETVLECDCDYGLLREESSFRLSPEVLVTVGGSDLRGSNLDLNENSALLTIECGRFSVLLTGDIEAGTEMVLTPSAVPVTVLKVPHHGSSSSLFPPYLRRLSPQLAVFSAGRGNPFGHPSPAAIEAYSGMGCGILRTDVQGTIVVQSDGEAFSSSAIPALYRHGDGFEH
ncbi:MAG: hypothetical protein AVO35_10875 [Candidatus Aegiribacteria sp. MLS_C]|nr:MAG: hypothetical protein AVO35_10875 [Candidatus Aegiribacteria sp. MLS_C]